MTTQYELVGAKTLINRLKNVDDWFWVRYTVNPYRGCVHACQYCDARSHTYQTHPDFETKILVKENAKEVLERDIQRYKADGVGIDGVTDAYQPAEKEFRITRSILQVFRDHNFPCMLDTKSDLVTEDLDLWQDIQSNAWAIIMFTITTFNEGMRKLFEPRAPAPEKRLEALRKVKEAGIENVGIAFMPIIPFILDSDENLEEVFKRSKEAGADFIISSSMTMKDRQKDRMMNLIGDNFNHCTDDYRLLYAKGMVPAGDGGEYLKNLYEKLGGLYQKYDIADRVRRPIASWEKYPYNIRVAEALFNKAYRSMAQEGESYRTWAYRKAGWSIYDSDKDIKVIYEDMGIPGLKQIPNVGTSIASMIEHTLPTIEI